jgi:hypothetical protein
MQTNVTWNNDMLACLVSSARKMVETKGRKLSDLRRKIEELKREQEALAPRRNLFLDNQLAHYERECSAIWRKINHLLMPGG